MKQFLYVKGLYLTVSQQEIEDFTVYVVVEKPETDELADCIEVNSVVRDKIDSLL